MFGLGMGEILVLAVLGLILIGPDQLPELARTIGRFINDLKRSTEGLTDDLKKQARADLDFDILGSTKNSANPFVEDKFKNLVQPPEHQTITNDHNPHGKKMTHNEHGELIIEPEVKSETQSEVKPETAQVSEDNQLSLFPEANEKKKDPT